MSSRPKEHYAARSLRSQVGNEHWQDDLPCSDTAAPHHFQLIKVWLTVLGLSLSLLTATQSHAIEGARLTEISSRAENRQALVFVHGVIGDPISTWTNKNGTYWPRLVAQELKDFNVFVFGYYTPPATSAPTIVQLAAQLTAALQAGGVLPTRYNGAHERLYFVAHSMGNLIVRQALQARSMYRYVEVPLLLSLGSPSAGAEVATIAKNFSRNPTLASMGEAPLNDFLQSLNVAW